MINKKHIPFFSACLACLLSACEQSAAPEPAASVARSAEQAVSREVDWTALFRPWEHGCLDQPPELEQFFRALPQREIVLPPSYRSGVRASVDSVHEQAGGQDEYWQHSVSISGHYYGMPVSRVGSYAGVENGIRGYFLELAVPPATAKAKLAEQQVEYRAPAGEYSDDFGETYGQATVDGDAQTTVISCDLST